MTVKHIEAVEKSAKEIFSAQQIQDGIAHMAQAITDALADKDPIVLCVVNGGIVITGQLLPHLPFPLQLDYAHATRYHGNTRGNALRWKVHPHLERKDRTILIVDDVLDQGVTLQGIVEDCRKAGAKEVYSAVLIDKTTCRSPLGLPKADFTGLSMEDGYIYGFGLDYKHYLRNANGIFVVDDQWTD